jgi:ADP-heptose:LPS heptosyltransferase
VKKLPAKNEVKTILFITLSNLGDIILTTPVLEKLRGAFPCADIDVITGAPGEAIFSAHSAVRNVTVRAGRQSMLERISELARLRRERYDLVADMKNSILPWLAGARFRSARVKGTPGHKKEDHLSKLDGLVEHPFEGCRFFLPISDSDREFIAGVISEVGGRSYVVMNPGAKSHLKRWPAANYAELADRLIAGRGCFVFVTGARDDRETVDEMLSLMREKAVDLCGETNLGALAELMRCSNLVVTNDSAPLHVASVVNAPVVAVFGPSDDRKYGPLSDRKRVVFPDRDCRPCGRALCSKEADEGCIVSVAVDEVLSAAEDLLAGYG